MAIIRTTDCIDLLFTNAVLPGTTGSAAPKEAIVARPGLRLFYTTGYSRNAIVYHGSWTPGSIC